MSSSFKLNIEQNTERIKEEMKRPTADGDVGATFTAKHLQSAAFQTQSSLFFYNQTGVRMCSQDYQIQSERVKKTASVVGWK